MNRLQHSLSAEWRKVRATKLWWILALVLAGYAAMMAAMFAFLFSTLADTAELPDLPADRVAGLVYSSATAFGYVVPLLFGALLATGELRHRTLRLTFALEPRRGVVLLAKLIALLGAGGVIGAAGVACTVGVGAAVLAATGADPLLGAGDTWALIAREFVALAVWAVIGFGLGLLVRHQAFVIVLALVFTQFIEPALRSTAQFWDWSAAVMQYLPGAASDAFVGASAMDLAALMDPSAAPDALGIWAGLAVLAAYGAVFVAAGWALRWRRDIV